jgi:hypothetical protein
MVRFIFVCMGVVALSFLTIASQYMIDGIQDAQQEVVARNSGETVVAVEEAVSPEELNAIDTAAGAEADAEAAAPGNQTFGDAFTAEAPVALRDQETPQAALGVLPAGTLAE